MMSKQKEKHLTTLTELCKYCGENRHSHDISCYDFDYYSTSFIIFGRFMQPNEFCFRQFVYLHCYLKSGCARYTNYISRLSF